MSKQNILRKISILLFIFLLNSSLWAQERGEEQKIFNFKCDWVYNSGTKITHDINTERPPLFNGPRIIEVDPGDAILFYYDFIDVDARKNCSGEETISCSTPQSPSNTPYQNYVLKFTSTNSKVVLSHYYVNCVNDFNASGIRNSRISFGKPVWVTLPSAMDWTSDIILTITLVDFGYDPEADGVENFAAPEKGTTKDVPYSIQWTIKKRVTPCPLDLMHVPTTSCMDENIWYPDPLDCYYQANPRLGVRPSYEGIRIEETFLPFRALGFTLADIKSHIMKIKQYMTADLAAEDIFGSNTKIGTFIIQEYNPLALRDIIVDTYSGFGRKTPFEVQAFNDADGVGWELEQYYKCNGTVVRTNVISGKSTSPLVGVNNFKQMRRK